MAATSSVEETLTAAIAQLEAEANLKKVSCSDVAQLTPVHPRGHRAGGGHCPPGHRRAQPPALVGRVAACVNRYSTLIADEAIATKALETIAGAHSHWVNIASLIPKGEFYR
jgi:hypothetical protein